MNYQQEQEQQANGQEQEQEQQQQQQQEQQQEEEQEQEQEQALLPLQPWPGNRRPLNRPTLSLQHQQRINGLRQSQLQQILTSTDFRNLRLPISRVRRNMKAETDVPNVSFEATVLTTRACEMFIEDLIFRSWLVTEDAQRLIIRNNDISSGVERADMYDFLVDFLPWSKSKGSKPFVCTNRGLRARERGESSRGRRDNDLKILMNYDDNNVGGGFGTCGSECYNNGMGDGFYPPNYNNNWGTGNDIGFPNYNNNASGEGTSIGIGTNIQNYNNMNFETGNNTGTGISVPNYYYNTWGEGTSTGIGTGAPNYDNFNWGVGTSTGTGNNVSIPQLEQIQIENALQHWPGLPWLDQYRGNNDGTIGTNYFPTLNQGSFQEQSFQFQNNAMDGFVSTYGGGGTSVPNYFAELVQDNNVESNWAVPVFEGQVENNGDNVGMGWTNTANWGLSEIFNTCTGGTNADNMIFNTGTGGTGVDTGIFSTGTGGGTGADTGIFNTGTSGTSADTGIFNTGTSADDEIFNSGTGGTNAGVSGTSVDNPIDVEEQIEEPVPRHGAKLSWWEKFAKGYK